MDPRLPAHLPRSGRGRRAGLTLLARGATFLLTSAAPALAAPSPAPTPGPAGAVVKSATNGLNQPVSLVLLLGSLSVLPGLLIMVTAFTRSVIVLGFTRSALGTQQIPPNQVLIGLALFLTFFVMGPTFSKANEGLRSLYA